MEKAFSSTLPYTPIIKGRGETIILVGRD